MKRPPEARVPMQVHGAMLPGAVVLERHAPRESVRALATDLSEANRSPEAPLGAQAMEMVLPDALIVADKFHVLALAGRALQEVHGETRRRGNLAWLLQRGVEGRSQPERARLLEALQADPRLGRAWGLKEALREVYRKKRQGEAVVALEHWIKEAEESGLRPFRRTAATLRRWQKEGLNYWCHPITNALVEGKHNRVKVLKRRAYG